MKAIVFATKMGGGHMSAANAVANALIQRGCASEVCDFLTLIGKRTSDIVGGAYIYTSCGARRTRSASCTAPVNL